MSKISLNNYLNKILNTEATRATRTDPSGDVLDGKPSCCCRLITPDPNELVGCCILCGEVTACTCKNLPPYLMYKGDVMTGQYFCSKILSEIWSRGHLDQPYNHPYANPYSTCQQMKEAGHRCSEEDCGISEWPTDTPFPEFTRLLSPFWEKMSFGEGECSPNSSIMNCEECVPVLRLTDDPF
jgi:hypothetical protein